MAEFEELKLQITLVDDMSAGLKNLNNELNKFGQNFSKNVAPDISSSAKTAQASIASLGKEFTNLASTAIPAVGGMVNILGGLGSKLKELRGIGGMGAIFGGIAAGVAAISAG